MIVDGQQILIADLQFNPSRNMNEWTLQKATVRQDGEQNRFHIEKDNGITLWGMTAEEVQRLVDSCDALVGAAA